MELGFRPGKIAGPAPEEPKLAKLSKMLQQVAVTIEEIAEKRMLAPTASHSPLPSCTA